MTLLRTELTCENGRFLQRDRLIYNLIVCLLLLEITSEIHPCLQTLSYSASRTVLPSDFVDDAVVPSSAQVVVLTCGQRRRGREDLKK